MNDALDIPVELGKTYGYSTTSGGWATVVIGEAIKFTKEKVTLRVKIRRHFVYGNPSNVARSTSPTVNVNSYHLFPVNRWSSNESHVDRA